MNEMILLQIGIVATVFISVFYFILRRIKRNLRRYVLRFEQIKDKFE
jgi:hypothetical protein